MVGRKVRLQTWSPRGASNSFLESRPSDSIVTGASNSWLDSASSVLVDLEPVTPDRPPRSIAAGASNSFLNICFHLYRSK